jgi:hypothetical protein
MKSKKQIKRMILAVCLAIFAGSVFSFLTIMACQRRPEPVSALEAPQPPNPNPTTGIAQTTPPQEAPPNPPGNLLLNPGFEEGRNSWNWLDWSKYWVDFAISIRKAHSGKNSAYLKIDSAQASPETEIHGVMQTLKPNRFPGTASGWYRVENWQRGAPKQYLQFVVMVWGGHPEFNNYQIRYILTGITTPPFSMRNVKYMLPPDLSETPSQNKWIHFEFPILADFLKQWGITPAGYDKINFFFEARYDEKPAGTTTLRADVYYDDLFVGD